MDTKEFGPPLWKVMFIMAANYEIEIDNKNQRHRKKKRDYKNFYVNMKDMIPCIYCRRSYKVFLKELPIGPYLSSRRDLMYWLYLIKDKVNKKLLKQYKEGKHKHKPKPSPPFEDVCKFYEKFRAECSSKTMTCNKPTSSKLLKNIKVTKSRKNSL